MLVDKIYRDIYEHLNECLPNEACGIIIELDNNVRYIKGTNLADNEDDFILDPSCIEYAEDLNAKILYIVHTHPKTDCQPSSSDLVGVEEHGIPWLIMDGNKQVSITRPSNKSLLGREFNYGTNDCLTIVTDYYKEKLNIILPEFPRFSKYWWTDFGETFESIIDKLGFEKVTSIELHDILIIHVNKKIPSHFAVYVGDGKILHHPTNRLSIIEPLTAEYLKCITHILRKK